MLLADRDHIFFEFKAKETSAEVRAMFRGFDGYVQADAKSVYDALFRPPDQDTTEAMAAFVSRADAGATCAGSTGRPRSLGSGGT